MVISINISASMYLTLYHDPEVGLIRLIIHGWLVLGVIGRIMTAPKLLDLFCGAGGAAMGYRRAGFDEIVGVDIKLQPHYPFEFVQADALEYPLGDFDLIHASPPCQKHSVMTKGRWQNRLKDHANLIPPTRERLRKTGRPYVIENVPGAVDELIHPMMLCGTMFGLETKYGSQLRRHRLFEVNFLIHPTPVCNHKKGSVIGVYGGGQHPGRRYHKNQCGQLVTPAKRIPATIGSSTRDGIALFKTQDRRDAMGIDWMSGKELSQAIPPAYTEFIGKQLIGRLLEG